MSTLPAVVEWLLARMPEARLIQTHISWVVLSRDRVYKVKRPVDLGFLDYRSLDQRRFFCDEEVRLNRRLSPDIYLGTAAIHRDAAGRFSLAGPAPVVEYAVLMRRIPDAAMFDAMLARGAGTAEHARALGGVIAAFHEEAERDPAVTQFGSPEVIAANWTENFEQAAPFVGRLISADDNQAIREFSAGFLDRQRPLLEQRMAEGYIRDCHGDLRAESVAFTADGVRVMDCIEFNARFRYGDVIGDLAFLLMDLDARDRPDLADEVLARYLTTTADTEAGRLLDFYRCYRAYVRGKVNGFQMDDPELPQPQRADAAELARRYFRLAVRYARAERARRLVVVMGAAASGKSYLAAALAGRLGASVCSSDLARKQLFGVTAQDHSSAAPFGQGMYAAAPTRDTYAQLRQAALAALGRGEPVILDATFTDSHERCATLALAARCGVPCDFIVCEADEGTVRERLRQRATDRSAVSDAIWDVAQRQRESLRHLEELPSDRLHRVPSAEPLAVLVPRAVRALHLPPEPAADAPGPARA